MTDDLEFLAQELWPDEVYRDAGFFDFVILQNAVFEPVGVDDECE